MDSNWRRFHGTPPSTRLVRVFRTHDDVDHNKGYIVSSSPSWTLMVELDDSVFLDGYSVIRTSDIERVETNPGVDSFVRQALTRQGEWPPSAHQPTEVPLETAGAILRSVRERHPVLTVYVEAIASDVCYIGHPVGIGPTSFGLLEISPAARWYDEPSTWQLNDITRIDFGGRYEAALFAVAGPLPA